MGIQIVNKKDIKNGLDFYIKNYDMSFKSAKQEILRNYKLDEKQFYNILSGKIC